MTLLGTGGFGYQNKQTNITHIRSSGSKTFIVEAGELIKIRFCFQSKLCEFWVEAIEAITEVTELVKSFSLVESLL